MTDHVGRCTFHGCPFRWRDGHDRPCHDHRNLMREPQIVTRPSTTGTEDPRATP